MNILHFYKTSIYESFGGVENFINELTLGTKNYGVNNTIIVLTKKIRIIIKNIKVLKYIFVKLISNMLPHQYHYQRLKYLKKFQKI